MIGLAQVSSCADGRVVDTVPLDEELSTKGSKISTTQATPNRRDTAYHPRPQIPASLVHRLFTSKIRLPHGKHWFVRVRGRI